MKKIAMIGATGLLGRPVANALASAGYEVTALVRDPGLARKSFEGHVRIFPGDMRSESDIRKLLRGHTMLYLNLSVKQTEKEKDWHSESDGIRSLLPIAREEGIQRIYYLSSLVQRYQGMNAFDWWVFRIKLDAIRMIRTSGIASTIFYPSTFMEAIPTQYMQGSRLLMAGTSKYKQHFIAARDYASQVTRAVDLEAIGDKDYVVQGPEAWLTGEALALFRDHYQKQKLSISSAPLAMLRLMGRFHQKMNYGAHILEALNNYPEKFEAEATWTDLGKPGTTLKDFAAGL